MLIVIVFAASFILTMGGLLYLHSKRRELAYLHSEVDALIVQLHECRTMVDLINWEEQLYYFKLIYKKIYGYDTAMKELREELYKQKRLIHGDTNARIKGR